MAFTHKQLNLKTSANIETEPVQITNKISEIDQEKTIKFEIFKLIKKHIENNNNLETNKLVNLTNEIYEKLRNKNE